MFRGNCLKHHICDMPVGQVHEILASEEFTTSREIEKVIFVQFSQFHLDITKSGILL